MSRAGAYALAGAAERCDVFHHRLPRLLVFVRAGYLCVYTTNTLVKTFTYLSITSL